MLKNIKMYLQLYFVFLRNCLQAQMEYRVNFLFSILAECGWICSHLLYLMVLYNSDVSIGNIEKESLYLFVGTYLVITGIYMSMFFTNFSNIPEYLRTGQFDLFITKPLSLQFIVTLRYVEFGYPIADFVAGIALIFIGWQKMGIAISFVNIAGFMMFMLLGIIWVYVLQLLPAILSFWTVKATGVYSISYAIHDMNKMPQAVYGKFVQRIGTFIYPIFPMANYGTLFVTGKLSTYELIWGIIGPIVFFAMTKFIWGIAVKKYVSAST